MNTLVVARYNEPQGWMDGIPSMWKPLVVQKGQQLPNEGREASSWFWAMQHLRKRTGKVAFVQGNPFDHCPNLFDLLTQPCKGFRWLGDTNHLTDQHGSPHHSGLPIGTLHERWLGVPFQGTRQFAAGAQFLMPAIRLDRYNNAFYKRLQAEMSEGEFPWVMERLWEAFFGDRTVA